MRKTTRKFLAVTAGVASIALLASACSSSDEPSDNTSDTTSSSAPADEPVTLKVATFNEFGYADLYKEYMTLHPNVTIVDDKADTSDNARAAVQNSIATIIGYLGFILAISAGLSEIGVSWQNIGIVAGGLSVGLGLGLQGIDGNFVSGLILLAERPFKVGDWIVAGDVSGTVKKISVRATEIETFQRQSVILPNSNLINNSVGNWTHRNKLGRIDIKVGVAYGSDVKQVHAILLEIARNHPLVLKNPEPFVLFANFGTAALEFEIRVFLADVMNGNIVQNDVRFAVLEKFNDEHIEIPSTPRAVVEIKKPKAWPIDDDKIEADFAEQEQVKAEAEAEKKRLAKTGRKVRKPDPD